MAAHEVGEFLRSDVGVAGLGGDLDDLAVDVEVSDAEEGVFENFCWVGDGAWFGGALREEILSSDVFDLMEKFGNCGVSAVFVWSEAVFEDLPDIRIFNPVEVEMGGEVFQVFFV